jgi:hypothetical protein
VLACAAPVATPWALADIMVAYTTVYYIKINFMLLLAPSCIDCLRPWWKKDIQVTLLWIELQPPIHTPSLHWHFICYCVCKEAFVVNSSCETIKKPIFCLEIVAVNVKFIDIYFLHSLHLMKIIYTRYAKKKLCSWHEIFVMY